MRRNADMFVLLSRLRDWWCKSIPVGASDGAALCSSTGWHAVHVVEAIHRAFAPFTDPALRRMTSLPRAVSPPKEFLVLLAGRIPAPAVRCLFHALAAGRSVALKPGSVEPVFPRLLVQSVRAVSRELASSVRLLDLPSGSPELEREVRSAPLLLVHGTDRTVRTVAGMRPGLPTISGGHMDSFVIVFAEALTRRVARRLARSIAEDVAVYDQSGCLSPQAVVAEEGGEVDPETLAALILEELRSLERVLPPGAPPHGSQAALRLFAEEIRYVARSTRGTALPGSGPPAPLVAVLPASSYRPGPGNRVLQVFPFVGQPDLPDLLAPMAGRVQGIAHAGDRKRLDALLTAFPAFRPNYLCRPGRLQLPPACWRENGVELLDFLR